MSGTSPALAAAREADAAAASAVKALQAAGELDTARERYAELVARHQRRAARIAYHYLRDSAEADEAVQDAFVKAYQHLASFREELPFDVWFTRILINGCLDRIKARTRRERWLVSMPESSPAQPDFAERMASGGPSPEAQLLARERRQQVAAALAKLPERQRSVFMLSHYEGCTSREVSALTGLNESTVRVHLFRAIRKLRTLLGTDAAHQGLAGEKRRVNP
jgi:RNA polymerase sigma-70 factor (ECF subfamily)